MAASVAGDIQQVRAEAAHVAERHWLARIYGQR
jgi:hypothetical protein